MTLKEIKKEIEVALYIIKTNFHNESELRGAFLLQIIGMFLNNFAFVLVWIFFFRAFGSINHWSTNETIALQGFIALVFGFCFAFGGGVRTLPRKIYNGSFDNFLLTPRSLYLRIATSGMDTSAFGDIIFGFALMVLYVILAHLSVLQVFLLATLTIPAALIFYNVAFLAHMIGFVLPDSERLSGSMFEMFFSPSMYPAALYQGVMRFIFFFGIPALAIGGVPVEVVRDVNPTWYVLIWAVAIAWTVIANIVLARMVRSYESGNLIGSRE